MSKTKNLHAFIVAVVGLLLVAIVAEGAGTGAGTYLLATSFFVEVAIRSKALFVHDIVLESYEGQL